MTVRYSFATRRGTFHIIPTRDGRWHAVFNDQSLGSYHTPAQAADDLAMGTTFSPGFDTSVLGISDDIGDWDRHPIAL
ncbi:hypothetical protein FAZ95_13935 [Trinickia violacea]|uniref:Uncharacterized protein n=1 Tax=Trinickia violacea TaxID=2571746 RepID=A0A4P8ISG2_9BURK|nr:hypothetical protein FAZ95_13935 [Trinickia violacea]